MNLPIDLNTQKRVDGRFGYQVAEMIRESDKISRRILDIINTSQDPLETKEIELILKNITRIKVLYRLNNLRGEGLIRGKPVGSGKGAWIWWRIDAFK